MARIAFFALVAVAGLVGAAHTPSGPCGSEGWPAFGIVEVRTGVPGGSQLDGENPHGIFYVDDRNYLFGNGVWLYEESNGIYADENDAAHNLQRGYGCLVLGCLVPDDGWACVDDGTVFPDRLLF